MLTRLVHLRDGFHSCSLARVAIAASAIVVTVGLGRLSVGLGSLSVGLVGLSVAVSLWAFSFGVRAGTLWALVLGAVRLETFVLGL